MARWRQLEQRGFVLFVLDIGLLRWGLPMCVVFTVLPLLFSLPMPARLTPEFVLRNAAIWGSAGLLYGAAMWFATKVATRRQARRAAQGR